MQNALELSSRIAKLSPKEQALVEELVDKFETRSLQGDLTLDQLVDEFERQHPELLTLLAQ